MEEREETTMDDTIALDERFVANKTLVESPGSFLFIVKSTLANSDDLIYILKSIANFCIDDGIMVSHFKKYMCSPKFRREWIEQLKIVSNKLGSIQKNAKKSIDTEDLFASMTHASMVYLYTFVNDPDSEGQFDRAAVNNFLKMTFNHINSAQKNVIRHCINALQAMLEFPLNRKRLMKTIGDLPKRCDVFAKDTIITVVKYMKIQDGVLIENVNNRNDVKEMFNVIDMLVRRLDQILHVKLCLECKEDKDKYGGIHELCEIVSFAVKLFERGIRKKIVDAEQARKVSIWIKEKIDKLKKLPCARRLGQKKQVVAELLQIEKLCTNEGLDEFSDIMFNHLSINPAQLEFLALNDVELLDEIYLQYGDKRLSACNEIIMQLLCLYEPATDAQKDRIERRCVKFVKTFSANLNEFLTPGQYFERKRKSGSTITQKSSIRAMSTVLHRCANRSGNIPVQFNDGLIEQLFLQSENSSKTNCTCKRFYFMLSQPFHQINAWYDGVKDTAGFSRVDCPKNPGHANTLLLLGCAAKIFNTNQALKSNLERVNSGSSGCSFEQVKKDKELIDGLKHAATDIEAILDSHAKGKKTLNSTEIDFCFRAIHFIKVRLNLLNFTFSHTFTSVIKLKEVLECDELKLKLATILAAFSNEYKNNEKWAVLEEFIDGCGESIKNSKVIAAADTIAAFELNYGLMLKRKQMKEGNEQGDILLQSYRTLSDVRPYQIIHLEYLATKENMISNSYFEDKPEVFAQIQSYFESIQLTNEDSYQNENSWKLLSAQFQLIFAIDRYNLSANGTKKFHELLQQLLGLCRDFGLHYQTLNLLLIQGSFQLNEPQKLQETLKLANEILSQDSFVSAKLMKHLKNKTCTCTVCSISGEIYSDRLKVLLSQMSPTSFTAYYEEICKHRNFEGNHRCPMS